MAEPEAVVEAPEPATEVAPAPQVEYRDTFNLYELFRIYEYGRAVLGKAERENWTVALSIAGSSKGLLLGEQAGSQVMLALFWTTDNPYENVRHWPVPIQDGNFVYVAWLFNEAGDESVAFLRDYLRKRFEGAKFLAHHEARKGRRREAVVMRLHPEENGRG